MPGFLNLLRGAVDTAGGIRTGRQQAEMQNLPLLVQLKNMADQRMAAREAAGRDFSLRQAVQAETERHNRATEQQSRPKQHIVGEDGTVQFFDPTDPQLPDGFKAHVTEPPGATNVYLPSVDPNTGQTVYTVVPSKGDVNPKNTGVIKPATGGEGGGMERARLETAKQQALAADEVMRKYEEKLLSGQAQITVPMSAAAKLALSGGALTGTTAEATLNSMDPELANYVRAAKQLATAERLITPRGGSNYLMAAEAMLSAAGAHGGPAQIEQARKYRQALLAGVAAHDGKAAATPDSTTASPGGNPFSDLVPKKP